MSIGKELPSTKFRAGDTELFPAREMEFYGSRVLLRERTIGKGKKLTIFGFKQSMPYKPENKEAIKSAYMGYGNVIDVNCIQDEKTQNEIVEKIRRSISVFDLKNYESFIVDFWGDEPKSYALIKHRDFSRLCK